MIKDGKVGYVVDPFPEDISEAIYRFYHENKEDEFIENVKKERARFSWEGLLEGIDNLMSARKGR